MHVAAQDTQKYYRLIGELQALMRDYSDRNTLEADQLLLTSIQSLKPAQPEQQAQARHWETLLRWEQFSNKATALIKHLRSMGTLLDSPTSGQTSAISKAYAECGHGQRDTTSICQCLRCLANNQY